MEIRCFRQKGVSVLEYAALIAIVVAALLGMAVYFRRSLSGKWRQAADTFAGGRQYDLSEGPPEPSPEPEKKIYCSNSGHSATATCFNWLLREVGCSGSGCKATIILFCSDHVLPDTDCGVVEADMRFLCPDCTIEVKHVTQ